MAGRPRSRSVVVGLVSLALMAGGVLLGRWASGAATSDRGAVVTAVALAPGTTRTLDVTDWAGIREALDTTTGPGSLDLLTGAATSRDLASRSVLAGSATALDDLFGWSPATVGWEAFAAGAAGGVLLLGVDEDGGQVADRLEAAGYEHLGDVRGADRWSAEESVPRRAGIDGGGLFTQAAFLPHRRVVVFAADVEQIERVVAVDAGAARSLADVRGAAGVATAVRTSLTTLVQTGELACAAADPSADGEAVRARADARLAAADPLVRYEWSARGLADGGESQRLTLAWQFADSGAAARQARARGAVADVVLAEAGRDRDRLLLETSSVDGAVAILGLARDPRGVAVMTATSPLLASACG